MKSAKAVDVRSLSENETQNVESASGQQIKTIIKKPQSFCVPIQIVYAQLQIPSASRICAHFFVVFAISLIILKIKNEKNLDH